jgi:hypothetical protein
MDNIDRFFAYLVERESVRIRREVLRLPRPWTGDPILQKYRFCNVYREDDKTTRWFRDHVRDSLQTRPEVLLATVLFRWFNRIATGEAIFCQTGIYHSGISTAWGEFLRVMRERGEVKTSVLRHAITSYVGERGPYVTGAYMIPTHMVPGSLPKLEGVLKLVEWFAETDWENFAESMLSLRSEPWTLAEAWGVLKDHRGFGPFMAYEVVTDLWWTDLLGDAPDAWTWANPGPGAKRGLDRIHGRDLRRSVPRDQQIREMRELLAEARTRWPSSILGVSQAPWTMREVEHGLCEFDKYERTRLGQGRPRGTMQ